MPGEKTQDGRKIEKVSIYMRYLTKVGFYDHLNKKLSLLQTTDAELLKRQEVIKNLHPNVPIDYYK